MKSKKYTPYIFLTLPGAFLVLFAFVPIVLVFTYSFRSYELFQPGAFVGFDHYRELLTDRNFWWALLNSVMYLSVTPVLIVLSLGLATLLRERTRINEFFRSLYFLPVVTPVVIAAIAWQWMFHEDVGIVNAAIQGMGLSDKPLPWLTQYPLNLITAMWVTVWRGMGYFMLIFIAGLMSIPESIEEAAEIDGASWWQRTLHITIPSLRPSIMLVFIISSINAVKVFTEVYIMLPGSPASNKPLVPYLYQQAFEYLDMGYASAVGVVLFMLTLGFSYLNMRYMERRYGM